MDNITHTLSGALAARAVRSHGSDAAGARRTLFWLMAAAANLPDIDIVARLVTDPFTALAYHRGITHSLVAAPVLAILPAAAFYRFGPFKNFRFLWLCAWLAVVIHIVLDLITPFGTQLFLPVSDRRFSLDWMFIIDPFFTLLMALGVWAARRWSSTGRAAWIAVTVLGCYIAAEGVNHRIAESRVRAYALGHALETARISAFPQPLNIFRWMGVIQTAEGVEQMFFTLFDDTLAARVFPSSRSALALRSGQMPEARWYLSYARHPWIRERRAADTTVVEFRDLQFSMDTSLARSLGMRERDYPFVLRYIYVPAETLREVRFDCDVIRTVHAGAAPPADAGKMVY